MSEEKLPLNVVVVDNDQFFQRMCDNLDAQNKLALESGTLPPEEEAILREVTYPHEAMLKAYELHKYQEEAFEDFKKRYFVMEKDGVEFAHFRSERLGAWPHTPNFASTRGMMLTIPPGHEIDIESDCCSDADDKAPAQPKVPPSNLLMKLMERIHG